MTYQPINWKDRIVEKPNTFETRNNGDNTVTLIPDPGQVLQEGTPLNAENLNHIEKGLIAAYSQLEQIATTSIHNDIVDTNYKKGDKVDVEKLRNIQIKKLNHVLYALRNKTKSIRFTHMGDSLTYGYDKVSQDKRENRTEYADGTVETTTIASKTYPEAMEEILKKAYDGMILPHINRGRSGDYASIALTRHNKKHSGDITLIMFGTNDSRSAACPYKGDVEQYLYYMEQLIIRELLWEKAVVILTPPIVQPENDMRVDLFANALIQLGGKYCIPVVNTQELINQYSTDIWSDVTHFNGKGYSIFGYRLASLFIGESLLNPNRVNGGNIITINDMRSSSCYNSSVLYTNADIQTTDTPLQWGADKGFYKVFNDENGFLVFSFYANEENMFVIPSIYIAPTTRINIRLDNGFNGCDALSSSLYRVNKDNEGVRHNSGVQTIVTEGVSIRYNKMYCRDNLIVPMRIANKGWHTISFEVETSNYAGRPLSVFGIEFVGYDTLNTIFKGSKELIYVAPTTGGYPGLDENITLLKDITDYSELYIQTGSVHDRTLITGYARTFNEISFRPNTDSINFFTANGRGELEIVGERELKIKRKDNEIRYIWGVVKKDL